MLADDYLRLKNEFNENGIIFSFTGHISESILYALGDALRARLTREEADTQVGKRVFSVFVELAQNIIRYSAEKLGEGAPAGFGSGVITVGIDGGKFFVACGNTVHSEDVGPLKARLEQLRDMEPAEIRDLYLDQIGKPTPAASLGGNLGLIEIARRASAPIQFDFLDLDSGMVFYCMKTFI